MVKWLNFYATYTFSTSPHSCYHTTLLNTKVPNFTVSKQTQSTFKAHILIYTRTFSIPENLFNSFPKIKDERITVKTCIVSLVGLLILMIPILST